MLFRSSLRTEMDNSKATKVIARIDEGKQVDDSSERMDETNGWDQWAVQAESIQEGETQGDNPSGACNDRQPAVPVPRAVSPASAAGREI